MYFNLEGRVELLSKSYENTFVATIFDCCREPVQKKNPSIKSQEQTRSIGD